MMENKILDGEPAFAVLNPGGKEKLADPVGLAERRPGLEGKVVYCISQRVGQSSAVMKRVAEELPRHIPGVITKYVAKSAAYMADDPELWDEIRSKGAAFIYGCGA